MGKGFGCYMTQKRLAGVTLDFEESIILVIGDEAGNNLIFKDNSNLTAGLLCSSHKMSVSADK